MVSCVIVDDELNARETLRMLLERYMADKIQVVATAKSVKEAVFLIYKHQPELVFLDIEMPEESGFKLFDYFKQVDFAVIFTTAYKNYAIEAVKVSALDYLLKPINFIDLQSAFQNYEKKQLSFTSNDKIVKLFSTLNHTHDPWGKIAFPTFDGYNVERINHVLYCEADQNYCHVHTIQGDNFLVSKSLGDLETMLPVEVFFRIHKSFLVNMNYVRSYSKTDGFQIKLENGTLLTVAQRRNEEFLKALTSRSL
ncbi:MAG: LytTR family DNA-binding domain-containing protein [Bacteroidota bacterium]